MYMYMYICIFIFLVIIAMHFARWTYYISNNTKFYGRPIQLDILQFKPLFGLASITIYDCAIYTNIIRIK